jgi:hypothetical protein
LLVAKLDAAKTIIVAKMAALVELIGSDPNESRNSYLFKSILVARYSYDLCQQPYDRVSGSTPDQTDINKYCCQYNDLSYSLCGIEEDILTCNTIANNVEDKKKYTFSISQLAAISV